MPSELPLRQVVYLKIPVNRDGFQDPPAINWSENKEEKLWKILSESSRTQVNWSTLGEQFEVPIRFLQQQAYWLYEKELEQLRSTIQRETLSSDSVAENWPIHKAETESKIDIATLTGSSKIFLKNTPDIRFPDNRSRTPSEPRPGNSTYEYPAPDEDEGSDFENSNDSDTDDERLPRGSYMLHRSRILSKAPPTFNDLDEDDDADDDGEGYNDNDDNLHGTMDNSKSRLGVLKSFDKKGQEQRNSLKKGNATTTTTTTESSVSNLSFSVSKSELEEALLDNSHF